MQFLCPFLLSVCHENPQTWKCQPWWFFSQIQADTFMFDKLYQDFLLTSCHSPHQCGVTIFVDWIGRVRAQVQQEHPCPFWIVLQHCKMERSPASNVLLIYFHSSLNQHNVIVKLLLDQQCWSNKSFTIKLCPIMTALIKAVRPKEFLLFIAPRRGKHEDGKLDEVRSALAQNLTSSSFPSSHSCWCFQVSLYSVTVLPRRTLISHHELYSYVSYLNLEQGSHESFM